MEKTVTDSVFVTTASSKATQSQDLDIDQSIKHNTLQQHCFRSCTAIEAKVSRYNAKLFPSSCCEVLFLRELQEGSQPADGARHNGPTSHKRKLLHNQCRAEAESLICTFKSTDYEKKQD